MKTQALPPFSSICRKRIGRISVCKAANYKNGKKGTAAKAAPYLFVFGHIRSVSLLTSAKAGFGSAEDGSRSGGILLTDMR